MGNGSTVPTTANAITGNLTGSGWKIGNSMYGFGAVLMKPNLAPSGTVTATAQWSNKTISSFPEVSREGYTFLGWYDAAEGGNQVTAVTVTAGTTAYTKTLYAHWRANSYTVVFHPNDGAELSPIESITIKYDELVKLPDVVTDAGADAYVRYTLDSVNITDKIISGEIALDAEGRIVQSISAEGDLTEEVEEVFVEDVTEETEELDIGEPEQADEIELQKKAAGVEASTEAAFVSRKEVRIVGDTPEEQSIGQDAIELAEEAEEPRAEKKAYQSVFMGWSLEAQKADFEPQWQAKT